MAEFRVVPVVGKEIYYKVQRKRWFGWNDFVGIDSASQIVNRPYPFPSISEARRYITKVYGTSVKFVDFDLH